jgi:hypothetical protein
MVLEVVVVVEGCGWDDTVVWMLLSIGGVIVLSLSFGKYDVINSLMSS